jgi:quinol monooxygenase YgiN
MLYARISLMTPKPDAEQQVARIMDDLVAYYAARRGYVSGYKLLSTAEDRQIGRVTIWRSEEDADTAAQSAHVLARRSELLPLVKDDYDASYYAADGSESLASLVQQP